MSHLTRLQMQQFAYSTIVIICILVAIFAALRLVASIDNSRLRDQMEAQAFDQARYMVLERRAMERGAY